MILMICCDDEVFTSCSLITRMSKSQDVRNTLFLQW